MEYLYPLHFEDETALSVAVAVGYTAGNREAKRLADLCIRRGCPLIYSLPCRLYQWEAAIGMMYGPGRQVLVECTCFPAFAAGMDEASLMRAVGQLASGTRSRTCFPRLQPLLDCGNRYGLRCPACGDVGGRQLGRTASLRKHCFPFVSRCALHGETLVLADNCSAYEAAMMQQGTEAMERNSRLYAWAAMQLLKTERIGDLRPSLLWQLAMLGYADEGLRWKGTRFSSDWKTLAKEGFEDVRLSSIAASEEMPTVLMRGLSRTERPMHPALLALLCWFLLRQAEAHAVAPTGAATDIPRAASEVVKHKPSLSELEEHRSLWLQQAAAHPNATRTELKNSLYGVWRWLYRNDNAWLLENQPPVVRKHTPKNSRRPMPNDLTARIAASRISDMDARGMPHTHTMYQNRVRYGMSYYAYARLLREIPALANECVSRSQLVSTRIDHLRHAKGLDVFRYSLTMRARCLSLRPETLKVAESQTTKSRKDK